MASAFIHGRIESDFTHNIIHSAFIHNIIESAFIHNIIERRQPWKEEIRHKQIKLDNFPV